MSRPNADEIHRALEAARGLAGDDTDEGLLASCFLYFHDRNLDLESVYEHVENYMHSGMAEREHTRLVMVLEHAREADHQRQHEDDDAPLGL